MSALDFLGGLTGAYTSVQKGVKDAEDRDQLLADREYQSEQRKYQAGQQKRALEEQGRADKLRADDAAIKTTEEFEVDLNKQNPTTSQITVDDDGNPSATQLPVMQTQSRKRGMYDIYRDYAANRRKAQDTAGALDYEQKAVKVATDLANRQASTLISQSAGLTLEQYAQSAAKLFNNDALPQSISKITPNANGTIQVDITHNDNGQSQTVTFKDKDELTRTLRAQYQPEAFAKLLAAQEEARIKAVEKINEERAKGVIVPAGGKFVPGIGDTRAAVDNNSGLVWTGRLNEDGTREMVRPGKYAGVGGVGGGAGSGGGDGDGTGGKKKGKSAVDVATSSVMDAIKESAESKTLNADQLIGVQATARELVANAARNNQELDPYVAGRIALTAVLKPDSVKPAYNPTTGAFDSTVSYNGNTFSVGRLDQSTMPESQLKGVAQAFVSKLPAGSKAEYIKAASGDQAAIDKINTDIAAAHGKQWADQFAASTGRRPTQQDVQASVARTQAIVKQNIQLVGVSGAVDQDKKARDTATKNQAATDAQKAIGTPEQIMALPAGKAAEIYRQYNGQTDGFQRDALQRKMQQDRRGSMNIGGMRQP